MEPKNGSADISIAMTDASHFSGCKGLFKVTNSHFQGMLDDAIKVHGTSPRIIEIPHRRSIVAKFMHQQSKGFSIASPDDEIRLIDNRTLLPLDAILYRVVKAEPIDLEKVRITFEDCLTNIFQFCRAFISIDPEVSAPSTKRAYHRDRRSDTRCRLQVHQVTTLSLRDA